MRLCHMTSGAVRYEGYNSQAAKVLGIMQLCLAAAVIVFNIAAICVGLEASYGGSFISAGIFVSHGDLCGARSVLRRLVHQRWHFCKSRRSVWGLIHWASCECVVHMNNTTHVISEALFVCSGPSLVRSASPALSEKPCAS